MRHTSALSFFIVSFLFLSCSEDPPVKPPVQTTVHLKAEGTDYTSITVRLSIDGADERTGFALTRNGVRIAEGQIADGDTILTDSGLIPSTDYRYRALRLRDGAVVDSSDVLVARTRDTTSSQFQWQTFTFGDNDSYLKDVFAISPNDVWAVGKIRVFDSTQSKYVMYNALHWNGKEWTKLQVPIILRYPNDEIEVQEPLSCVFAPEPNDVWFNSESGGITRWKNNEWLKMRPEYGKGVGIANKIWGRSSSDIYFVKPNGGIRHWNGTDFTPIESGTSYDINDIWGVGDTALAIASNWLFERTESKVIRLVGRQAEMFPEEGLPKAMKSIWFRMPKNIFAVGGYFARFYETKWEISDVPGTGFLMSIRGHDNDDIIIAGQRGLVLHFNGIRWNELKEADPTGSFYINAVSLSNNHSFLVGTINAKAVILRGNR